MPDTGNAKDGHPQIFDFYVKKRDLANLFDYFHSTVLFSVSFCLYRACFTHLMSSNLSCNLYLWYYDQMVHFNKEINVNVYRHGLWEYSNPFHAFDTSYDVIYRNLYWSSLRSKRFQSSYCAKVRAEAKKGCRHVKNDLSGTIHSSGYKFRRAAALQPVSKRSLQ